ncbi:hypothetical protein BH09CHL1_BH09CHL1_32570 [soil metagenome]
MKPTEYEKAWEGWSAIERLNLSRRTGRLAAFYAGRHHVFFDLSGGTIAAIYLSDRQLRIEYVMTRMGLITADDVHRAFHRLEEIDRITPLSHVLLEQKAITCKELGAARQQQMIEALQAVMVAERDALMFIPGPANVQKVESVIRIEDVLASAFAEFRLDTTETGRSEVAVSNDLPTLANRFAAGRKLTVLWSEPARALSRQAR